MDERETRKNTFPPAFLSQSGKKSIFLLGKPKEFTNGETFL
jgi:hypothetical protein